MRATFDQFHPPISLVDHLAAPDAHKTLRRLKVQGALSAQHWSLLYPSNKRRVTSLNFDGHLLVTLLKHVCRLAAPYPNGWEGEPLERDESLSADLVRFLDYVESAAQSERVSDEHLPTHLANVTSQLLRIVGRDVNVERQLDVIKTSKLTSDAQRRQYVTAARTWAEQIREQRVHERNMAMTDAKRQQEHELTRLQASIEGRRRRMRSKTAPASNKPKAAQPKTESASSALSRMKSVSDDKQRTGNIFDLKLLRNIFVLDVFQ